MAELIYGDKSQRIEFTGNEPVLDALLRAGILIDHSCGGGASCGTCRVLVQNQDGGVRPDPPEALEEEFRLERGFGSNERLSCQMKCKPGLHVKKPTITE